MNFRISRQCVHTRLLPLIREWLVWLLMVWRQSRNPQARLSDEDCGRTDYQGRATAPTATAHAVGSEDHRGWRLHCVSALGRSWFL